MQEEDSPVLTPGAGKSNVSSCGIVEVPLVVGGVQAGPREFPHMVRGVRTGCPPGFPHLVIRARSACPPVFL